MKCPGWPVQGPLFVNCLPVTKRDRYFLLNEVRHTLGKAEKLKSRKQIDDLFASGKSFLVFPIKLIYKLGPITDAEGEAPAAAVQIGVSASKRQFKHAADRNRIKRLLREAYRLNKQELVVSDALQKKQLSVFFVFIDKTLPDFALVEAKMKTALRKLRKAVEDAA